MQIATPTYRAGRVVSVITAVLVAIGVIVAPLHAGAQGRAERSSSTISARQFVPMSDAASSDSWGSVDSSCGGEGAITARNTYSFRNKDEEAVSRQSVGTITVAKHRTKKNTYLIRANNETGKKQKVEVTGYAYDHGKNLFAGKDKGKVSSYAGCVVIKLEPGQELSFSAKITIKKKGKDPVHHRNLNGFKFKTG